LLTDIYQAVDKSLGTSQSSEVRYWLLRKASKLTGFQRKEVRPQTNFGVFQDLLLLRIKRLLSLKRDVEKAVGETQRKWEAKYSSLQHNQDSRLRQLDRLESALKNAQDTQRAWKARLVMKSSEIDAHRVGPAFGSVHVLSSARTQYTSFKLRSAL
jgi:hypothetical protein